MLAKIAIRLAIEKLLELFFKAYNARRLIYLNRNPSDQPIGVEKVLVRIIGKCIIKRKQNKLCFLGVNRQIYLGRNCGHKPVIHSLHRKHEKFGNGAVLPIEPKNTIECLNRNFAVKNI